MHHEPDNTRDQNVTAHQFTAFSTISHFVPPICTLHYHILPSAQMVLHLHEQLKQINFAFLLQIATKHHNAGRRINLALRRANQIFCLDLLGGNMVKPLF